MDLSSTSLRSFLLGLVLGAVGFAIVTADTGREIGRALSTWWLPSLGLMLTLFLWRLLALAESRLAIETLPSMQKIADAVFAFRDEAIIEMGVSNETMAKLILVIRHAELFFSSSCVDLLREMLSRGRQLNILRQEIKERFSKEQSLGTLIVEQTEQFEWFSEQCLEQYRAVILPELTGAKRRVGWRVRSSAA